MALRDGVRVPEITHLFFPRHESSSKEEEQSFRQMALDQLDINTNKHLKLCLLLYTQLKEDKKVKCEM